MVFDKGFSRDEFSCKCKCGFDTVDVETLFVLEELKRWLGKRVYITSGCRCHAYNAFMNGSKNSYHTQGRAADISVEDVDPIDVYGYLDRLYPDKYGIGKYKTFVHIDTRANKARW